MMHEPASGSAAGEPLRRLSVVIPARDEEGSVGRTVEHLHLELSLHQIPHEIVVVDDGSSDATWQVLQRLHASIPELVAVKNEGPSGFGRAVIRGIHAVSGDAVVIMMADESDDCRDVVKYWQKLNDGYEAVFGSRFISGGGVIDYPFPKYLLNRAFNLTLQVLFGYRFNDTTNAFKAYRKATLLGLQPLLSPHFNLTVELPLKTIVRGYSWCAIPITWRNRRHGVAKLKIKEMGARYVFIVLYVWLEKYFSRGDFRKRVPQSEREGEVAERRA
jgi:dolichol-phosphate mannosyltransferase